MNNPEKPPKSVFGIFTPDFQGPDFVALVIQVAIVSLGAILGGTFLGIYLDKLLGSKPAFTLLLALGSAPLSLYLTYQIAKLSAAKIAKQTKKMEEPPSE
jgi:F0F1-type ATP synthase assembly protein I